MAASVPISRSLLSRSSSSPLSLLPRLLRPKHSNPTVIILNPISYPPFSPPSTTRPLCTSPETPNPTRPNPKLTNFTLSDSEPEPAKTPDTENRSKQLPPPYDPFNKKPAVEEPDQPARSVPQDANGRAVRQRSQDVRRIVQGRADPRCPGALQAGQGQGADAQRGGPHGGDGGVREGGPGRAGEALKVYRRMLGSGVMPNAYTEEREVREVLKGKRGPVVRSVMSLLFGN